MRSHVNMTQTNSALSMITKAGMPSRKVIVGVTSYGRSFRMAQAGCTGHVHLYGDQQDLQCRAWQMHGYVSPACL